nr:MAG TPA: hypothetical protein [Caudoviricetes sp.]
MEKMKRDCIMWSELMGYTKLAVRFCLLLR